MSMLEHEALIEKYLEDNVKVWQEVVEQNQESMELQYTPPNELKVKMWSKRFQSKEHAYIFTKQEGELIVQTPLSPPVRYQYCTETNVWRVR